MEFAVAASDEPEWVETTTQSPFLMLNIEIPASPLFKDSEGGLVIPQVPLLEILKKYDGTTWTDHVGASGLERKRYRLLKLPQYLIFHLGRFTMNNFNLEKNHTIVTFPVKNLEMKDYLAPQTPVLC
jgi:U4/U6.U5 tri-snRNP-associated protein 2